MFLIFDPLFKELIDPKSEFELLAKGFIFTEGPVWHSEEKCLYFSDIPANTIFKYSDEHGVTIYRKPSQYSNGLTLNKKGELIICEHETRSISIQVGKKYKTLVGDYNSKKLNSPNDIVISKNGSIIFTDPTYGLRPGLGGPAEQELDFQGVYLINPEKMQLELLINDLVRPNGLALSQDEKLLYVIDSEYQHIRLYSLEDGKTSFQKVFAELWGDGPGRPDGMKIDQDGNVFCTGPGGVWVFSSAGKLLGKIHLQQKTANLAWGDRDRKSLYITSSNFLFRLRCITSGRSPMDG